MTQPIVIAIGILSDGSIKNLYTGPDVVAAQKAASTAGEKANNNICDAVIFKDPAPYSRINFDYAKAREKE